MSKLQETIHIYAYESTVSKQIDPENIVNIKD